MFDGESVLVYIGCALLVLSVFAGLLPTSSETERLAFWSTWATGCVLMFLGYLQEHHYSSMAFEVVTIIIVLFWRWRKNRDKVKKWLGAKSKALRAKLVKKIRQLKPRPIRVPVPVPH